MADKINSNFVKSSLAEFISVWSVGGEASLSLNTKDGRLNMSFNLSLGHPGTSFTPSPETSSSAKPRHRGPVEKERGRQRAARHQASKATAPVPSPALASVPVPVVTLDPVFAPAPAPPPVTAPVTASVTPPVTSTVTAPVTATITAPVTSFNIPSFASMASRDNPPYIVSQTEPVKASTFFKCDQCDFRGENKGSLEHHIESIHRELQCQYCDFKVISINSMNTHIQIAHNYIQPTPSDFSSSNPPAAKLPVYVPGTTYSSPEYSRPGNAPPPPPCEKCGSQTWWICSRVKQDMGWLHEFFCHCLTRKCISTPPVI